MASSDLTRVRANIQAQMLLSSLRGINTQLATHQLRVGTGVRINSAADDPAGLTLSTKLRSQYGVLRTLHDNAGQVKNLLVTAEGSLLEIKDILTGMGEKIMAAASDTLAEEQRQAIVGELTSAVEDIDEFATQTEFNGMKLLDQERTFRFQTMRSSQVIWTTAAYDAGALGLSNLAALTPGDTIDASNYEEYYVEVEEALATVSAGLTDIGAMTQRLTSAEGVLTAMRDNTEAAYSRIYHADVAEERIELARYQILQQTALAMLAQANLGGASVVALFERT